MKIRLLSDFHAEFFTENFGKVRKHLDEVTLLPLPTDAETVLVLAGDICSVGRKHLLQNMLKYFSKRFFHVIYIPGNHEAYNADLLEAGEILTELASALPNISGHTSRSLIGGRIFHHCILWTDFDNENPVTLYHAGTSMNDYRRIRFGERLLRPEDVLGFHKIYRQTLEENINEGDIVITHHAPSFKSIHPSYLGDPLNGCYASSLESLILDKKPALWMHGHVHHHHDYMIGDTRVVCNPKGYIGEKDGGYKNGLIIEI